METQFKYMIRLFCIMIMFLASLLPAMYNISIAQASTISPTGQIILSDGDDDDDDDHDDDHDDDIYGIITAFPSSLIGTWQVGGMTFVADQNTKFEQEGAPFAVGLTVEVEYVVQDGINIATEIESDDNYINANQTPNVGVITQMGGVSAASAGNSSAWVIGGSTYQVSANTQLNGTLAIGMQAAVNSYVDANGVPNASRISGLTMDNHIYLPVILH